MMKNKSNKQGGFLELIVIILVALILLRFLNIDITAFFAKAWVKEFLSYVKDMLIMVWADIKAIYHTIVNS